MRQIHLFNKFKLHHSSTNYMFIAKVTGSETRHRNNKNRDEQSKPWVNNDKLTKTNWTLHKRILLKDVVSLPHHSLSCILSHQIASDSTSNGSNGTGKKGTSNRTFKICLATPSIEKNDDNVIAVGKTVNVLMQLIHCIEVDANKFKIAPWKNKQPNLEVLKYTKGWKYPEAELRK